ncbi:hypothetical protein [Peredibacter starrii]|uniref:Site-specific recombinase n=1 Tax=Peredibacter starrii TaxID=28202 RepID=A0AAX4HKU3_9BACT|nr:hypothetical protein [Peredibacter starrii]WPU63884.1 hypothetical protein SOO65_14410 [Peredibacter starrii]
MLKFIRQIKSALSSDLTPSDLATHLSELDPKYTFKERMVALGLIMDWIRLPVKSPPPEGVPSYVHSRDLRFKFLFQFLERHPEEAQHLASTLQELMVPGGAVGLYCLIGISEKPGFFVELTNRMVQNSLPDTFTEKDISETFKNLFAAEEDAIWIETSFKNILPAFEEFAHKNSISFDAVKNDRIEAMIILGAKIASLGTDQDIRRRLDKKRFTDSSFLRLNRAINREQRDDELILREVSASRLDLQTIRNNIEATGVSVDLIFKLEKISSILDRIEMLIYLEREAGPVMTGQFIGRLVRDELKSRSVNDYIRENLHLLTRKIVERAGEKGDHYIATTKDEKRTLFIAAALAGILTTFTAVVKFYIGAFHLPLFFEGFFFFVNYAFGFLAMQKWHLALSSKQPAYLASALSRKFESFMKTKELDEVTSEVKKIVNSQLLTTFGNLLLVIPVTIAVDWAWVYLFGHHIMTADYAASTIDKHNIFTSLTIPFAILTGVCLWLSSVVAGWVENWLVFREIPEAIRNNTLLKNAFGKVHVNSMADQFAATMGGIAGNTSIAFLLATPIIIGKFSGLPLDIRHVTLATGTITLALNSMEWDFLRDWPTMLNMVLSVLTIGFFNFTVSFYCSIRMAAMARNVDSRYLKIIFKYSFRKRTRPLAGQQ